MTLVQMPVSEMWGVALAVAGLGQLLEVSTLHEGRWVLGVLGRSCSM